MTDIGAHRHLTFLHYQRALGVRRFDNLWCRVTGDSRSGLVGHMAEYWNGTAERNILCLDLTVPGKRMRALYLELRPSAFPSHLSKRRSIWQGTLSANHFIVGIAPHGGHPNDTGTLPVSTSSKCVCIVSCAIDVTEMSVGTVR